MWLSSDWRRDDWSSPKKRLDIPKGGKERMWLSSDWRMDDWSSPKKRLDIGTDRRERKEGGTDRRERKEEGDQAQIGVKKQMEDWSSPKKRLDLLIGGKERRWLSSDWSEETGGELWCSLLKRLKPLKKCSNRLIFFSTFWLVICKLMRIRILIWCGYVSGCGSRLPKWCGSGSTTLRVETVMYIRS